MPGARAFSDIHLVNRSTGDPALYIDYPGKNNALLFDAGELASLTTAQLADLEAVFITHHHMDHFVGFDRILRTNIDCDKTLHVFGPINTIERIYQRITAYEIQFFPFQKIVFRVCEVLEDRLRWAALECVKQFPPPRVEEAAWTGPVIFENADLQVEAVHVEHTVPCLAFAMVEKTGYHPDADKLRGGVLRPGPWVEEALNLLRAGAAPETV